MKEIGLIAMSPPPENKPYLDAYGHVLVFKTGDDARDVLGPYINLLRLVNAKVSRKSKGKPPTRLTPC